MKITFECPETFYKGLCNIDEYVRQSPDWQHKIFTSFDDVMKLVLDHGFRLFDHENPEFQAYEATLHGAEVLRDEDGNIEGFYLPEK